MSRIGKEPVRIPTGVDVALDGAVLSVTGPKGTLTQTVHPAVHVEVDDGTVTVTRNDDEPDTRALHGLTRALVANMVHGVSEGWERRLEIVGVGYRATQQGADIQLQVGYSHPVTVPAPEGITITVPAPTQIVVSGVDKQQVGQVAADIRAIRRPEPYKGKGIRYAGEQVRRKSGKAAGV